jgi:hypothetical protein
MTARAPAAADAGSCSAPGTSGPNATKASGNPSFTALSSTPIVSRPVVVAATLRPYDPCTRRLTPIATAPPAGTVLATAVDSRWASAACPRVAPSMSRASATQVVTSTPTVSRVNCSSATPGSARTASHAEERSASCGSTPTNTPATMIAATSPRRTSRHRDRGTVPGRATDQPVEMIVVPVDTRS